MQKDQRYTESDVYSTNHIFPTVMTQLFLLYRFSVNQKKIRLIQITGQCINLSCRYDYGVRDETIINVLKKRLKVFEYYQSILEERHALFILH